MTIKSLPELQCPCNFADRSDLSKLNLFMSKCFEIPLNKVKRAFDSSEANPTNLKNIFILIVF
jgi:hypothetical protein